MLIDSQLDLKLKLILETKIKLTFRNKNPTNFIGF